MATAERINYPAPLPEDPATDLLTEMLFLAPYDVPEKKARNKGTGTRKSLRRKVVWDSSSEDTEAHSSNDNEEEEEEEKNPLPQTGGDKRKASAAEEAEGTKKGRTLPPDHSTTAAYSDEEWLPRDKPLAKL